MFLFPNFFTRFTLCQRFGEMGFAASTFRQYYRKMRGADWQCCEFRLELYTNIRSEIWWMGTQKAKGLSLGAPLYFCSSSCGRHHHRHNGLKANRKTKRLKWVVHLNRARNHLEILSRYFVLCIACNVCVQVLCVVYANHNLQLNLMRHPKADKVCFSLLLLLLCQYRQ